MPRKNVIEVVIGADDRTQAAFQSATQNAARFAAGLTAALGGTVAVAAQFEQGLAEIQTLLGKGATPEIARMREEMLALSKQTGQTLGALTRARYDIISAGFSDAADSAKVLDASIKVARGGLVDAATAADLVTTAINGLGLSAEDAGSVADDLFTIVRLGKTTMTDLAGSLGQVFSTAKIAGVSLDEVGAAMAVATAAGIDTARSATSLNQLMLALAAPTDEAKKALDELGISLDQGLAAAFVQLSEVSAQGLDALRDIIPSVEALRVAGAVANNMDKFNASLGEMGDNAGAAEEAVDIMSETLIEQLKELRQSAVVFAEAIGRNLLPQVKALVDRATGLISAFDSLPDGIKSAGTQATLAAAGVTALAAAFGQLAISINAAVGGLAALKGSAMIRALISGGAALGGAAAGLAAPGAVVGGAAAAGGALLFGGSTGEATRDLSTPAGQRRGGRIPLPGPGAPPIPGDVLGYINSLGPAAGAAASRGAAAVAGGAGLPIWMRPAPQGGQFNLRAPDRRTEFGGFTEGAGGPGAVAVGVPGMVEGGPGAPSADDLGLSGMSEDMAMLAENTRQFGEAWAEYGVVEAAWGFGDAIAQALVYGEEFGEVFVKALKAIVAQLISAIVQFVILQVVLKTLLNAVGLGGFGSILGLAQGSMSVPGPRLAAAGFMSVPEGGGLDNVPVLLRGGETVLSPDRANMLRSALYQPQQGRPSLVRDYEQRRGGRGVLVGTKDSFTASEAVDFTDVLERARAGSEGLV